MRATACQTLRADGGVVPRKGTQIQVQPAAATITYPEKRPSGECETATSFEFAKRRLLAESRNLHRRSLEK